MRTAMLVLAALVVISVMGCGGQTDLGIQRTSTVTEFIDTNPIRGTDDPGFIYIPGGFLGVVSRADAIVVAEVLEIVDVTVPTSPAPPNWPVAEIEGEPLTTYSAGVDQWVKGVGEDNILITGFGGITASGPRFTDGDFLLEPGRRYVLALLEKREGLPGPGQYERSGLGLGAFEVTDGYVHVLNNWLSWGLDARFGGMPLEEFVGVLKGYVANPPPSPTPRPSPEPQDLTLRNSFVIDTVAIDTDVSAGTPNTATSLGPRAACNTLKAGDTLTIDVTVDAVAAHSEGKGGIVGFQFALLYDPAVVNVVASDESMLLAANPDSSPLPVRLTDAVPDADGSFLVADSDASPQSGEPESGPGVLARITLEGVGPGVSDLALDEVIVVDRGNLAYNLGEVVPARVAVDAPCP